LKGVIENPQITLFNGFSPIASNQDWTQTQEAAIRASGLAPTDNREAALLAHLPAGNFTVHLTDEGGGEGLGIIEVFVLEDGNRTSVSTHLLDISTRGMVGRGDDVMIGGFIVDGPEPASVALLARGEGLVVPGGLSDSIVINDPVLEVYSGSTRIGQSDNWIVEESATVIRETGIDGELKPLDAGMVQLLEPGPYTVIVRGKGEPVMGQGIGIGIVEVFHINNRVPDINVPSEVLLDLGDVFLNTTKTMTLTLRNQGLADMTYQPFDDQFEFPFLSPSGTSGGILPGQSAMNVSVTFSAKTPVGDVITKQVFIETNDPDTPVVTLTLRARTVVPL